MIRLLAWLRARYEKECAESDAQYREWQRIHDPFGFAIEESKAKSKEGRELMRKAFANLNDREAWSAYEKHRAEENALLDSCMGYVHAYRLAMK